MSSGKSSGRSRNTIRLGPRDIARILGLRDSKALKTPLLTGIGIATGLAIEALEDCTMEEWANAGVELGPNEVTLRFRRRQPQRAQE